MIVTKKDLSPLDGCYSVSVMEHKGKPHVFFASDAKDGDCFAWDLPDMKTRERIWSSPGGCMSMVSIPGRPDEFFTIQKFYRLWDWEGAELVWVKPDGKGGYSLKTMATLPYLHRFDFLDSDGTVYLLAATLAAHKKEVADWSEAGTVYVSQLPANLDNGLTVIPLREDLFQNHGYSRIEWNGRNAGLITCCNGAFVFTPPINGGEWTVEQLMDIPISDADMIDIDGDGELEIATIEAFHGDRFRIYKKIGGQYKMIFEHPEIADFYHVVRRGVIGGKPVFIGGGRGGKEQLFVVHYDGSSFGIITLDEGEGPSNAATANIDGHDIIFAANRNSGFATAYVIGAE